MLKNGRKDIPFEGRAKSKNRQGKTGGAFSTAAMKPQAALKNEPLDAQSAGRQGILFKGTPCAERDD